jgi:hypothetical protein
MADQTQERLTKSEAEDSTRPRLLEQLAKRDEEILRLRDLLIGRDAELGAARGQLAVLQQHSQRLESLAARLPIPGLGRLVAAVLRRLRG